MLIYMPNVKSAFKRMKTNLKRNLRNRHYKSTMRTFVKKTKEAISKGASEEAKEYFKKAVSIVDRMVKKSILHWKTAARIKSRLQQKLNSLKV